MYFDYIIFTRTKWDEPPRARHQLTEALAKKYKILFIEANKFGFNKNRLTQIYKNLYLITPFWLFPYQIRYRLPLINEIYQKKIEKFITKQRITFGKLIIFDHTAHYFFNNPKYFKIYYCNDNFINNGRYSNYLINLYHKYCEKKLARDSKCCFVTTSTLQQKLSKFNKYTFIIKLGATQISKINNRKVIQPKIQKIIHVVFIGFIDTKYIDRVTLKKIASDKRINLNIIGPVSYNTKKEFSDFNVTFHGVVKGEELLKLIEKMDIGIGVYSKYANSGTTPNKFWQYLAAGLPFVCTNLEALDETWEKEKYFISLVDNNEKFIDRIINEVYNNTIELRNKRIVFAKNNTWYYRVLEFEKYLQVFDNKNY